MKKFSYRLRGVTMVELLIATTISAVVITGLFASLGNIYFSQKKINATQSFASESRFLMERVAQLVRNNTLDYDRFFVEVGPDPTGCANFSINQIPYELRDGDSIPPNPADLLDYTNSTANRDAIGYPNLFYWNVTTTGIERYRNLGGKKLVGGSDDQIDPCAQAWNGTPDTLYLINKERTERTAVRLDASSGRLQMQKMLGVDAEGNGKVDSWGTMTIWDNFSIPAVCKVYNPLFLGTALNALDEKTCARAHDWENISPEAIEVLAFEFIPTPDRDPYLNYRIDAAQIQPQSFLRLHTKLRRPLDFGVRSDQDIKLIQQTIASSRVFGDPR